MKTKLEKDIETTIRVIRQMTGGQGYASVSIFDAGAGGGFSESHVNVNLERDGKTLKKTVYSPEELKNLILASLKVYSDWTLEDMNKHYIDINKRYKWNE